MNWKKEGYTVGQEVFLKKENMFIDDAQFTTGIVTYVGTKILKVKTEHGINIKFTGGCNITRHSESVFTVFYTVYYNEEAYNKEVREKEEKLKLIEEATSKLKTMSIKELRLFVGGK